MTKSTEESAGASPGRIGWGTALDHVVFHKWAMPFCGMILAASTALLASQILAWKLDRSNLQVLPDVAPPPPPAVPAAVRISAGGFIPQPAAPATPAAAVVPGTPLKSALPLELIGTFVSTPKRPNRSLAILQMTTGGKEVEILRIGEKWQKIGVLEIELLEVDRARILIKNLLTGAREYISNDQLLASVSAPSSPRVPRAEGVSVSGSLSDEIVLSRAQINRAIDNNTNIIFSWVDVQPYAVAGKVEGFRLNNIKPRGKPFFEMLRFKEGDIVKRVNGVKMDSVDKAVGLWSAVHGKDRVSFTIERQGVEKEINLVFKE